MRFVLNIKVTMIKRKTMRIRCVDWLRLRLIYSKWEISFVALAVALWAKLLLWYCYHSKWKMKSPSKVITVEWKWEWMKLEAVTGKILSHCESRPILVQTHCLGCVCVCVWIHHMRVSQTCGAKAFIIINLSPLYMYKRRSSSHICLLAHTNIRDQHTLYCNRIRFNFVEWITRINNFCLSLLSSWNFCTRG